VAHQITLSKTLKNGLKTDYKMVYSYTGAVNGRMFSQGVLMNSIQIGNMKNKKSIPPSFSLYSMSRKHKNENRENRK
jgi:arabinogalactan endo-1,4-beta-galactosidase